MAAVRQAYPDLSPWDDLTPYLVNGWTNRISSPAVIGVGPKSVSISALLRVGTDAVIARNLPVSLPSARYILVRAIEGTGEGQHVLVWSGTVLQVSASSVSGVLSCDRIVVDGAFPRA